MTEIRPELPPLPSSLKHAKLVLHEVDAIKEWGHACRADLVTRVQELEAAAKLALDALIGQGYYDTAQQREAIEALRKAGIE